MPIPGFNLAELKARSRQSLHEVLAVAAVYTDFYYNAVPITVRWHNKIARAGAIEGGFDVEILSGVDRLVFNRPELTSAELVLDSGGEVSIPEYGIKFVLDAREPYDGPVNEYWGVAAIIPVESQVPPDLNTYIGTEDGHIVGAEDNDLIDQNESPIVEG